MINPDAECYACHVMPCVGAAAYCAACQPRNPHPPLRGAQCRCAACGVTLATLTDFDAHQVRPGGVFTGECLDPAALGLEPAGHVWGTPEGNARRAQLARDSGQLRAARRTAHQNLAA